MPEQKYPDPDFLAALEVVLQKLRDRPPMHIRLPAVDAMLILAQLQLALVHSDNCGVGANAARRFCRALHPRIARDSEILHKYIQMGFDRSYDVISPPEADANK